MGGLAAPFLQTHKKKNGSSKGYLLRLGTMISISNVAFKQALPIKTIYEIYLRIFSTVFMSGESEVAFSSLMDDLFVEDTTFWRIFLI